MPRPEDIAWKFVIRQGKKWRCPYCKIEYSGSVPRVRSHFLKQTREGIASCTKVPEHISTLMEFLHNHEVRSKDDIAWKFVERLGDGKWRCHHCREEFFGDLIGVKAHLLGVPNEKFCICTQVPDHIRKLMQSLLHEVGEEQSRDAHGQSSTKLQSRDMPPLWTPASPEYARQLLPMPQGATHMANFTSDQDCQFQETLAMPSLAQSGHGESISCSMMALTEEERRGANGQSSTEPQSRQVPAQAEVVAEEESREAYCQISIEPQSRDQQSQEEYVQQTIREFMTPTGIQVNSDQQSQADRQFPQSSMMPLLVQSCPALVPPSHQSVLHQSINHETRDTQQNATMPLDNLDTNQKPALHDYTTENLVEPFDAIVNLPKETQTNEVLNPTVGSSLQNELSLHVDHMNHSEACSQPCVVEGVPVLSNTSPANTVQHPGQLPPRCDKEDGNDTRLFPRLTRMDLDPPIALPRTSDSHDNLQVPELATNTIGPSSSQDMNRHSSIMTIWSIYAKDEEKRNLKRKLEEINDKEAVTKEQMEIESAASPFQKKPRISVERWLKETERARNNFQITGQALVEMLPPKEQVEILMREVEELREKMLPQILPVEERDAKGVKFLVQKLTGEATHRNINLIWDLLTGNHACKLGIYGMGGVGKTTIMMHIYNRLLKDATFDGVAFITVSQNFSIYKLQSDIWKALKSGVMEDEHEKKRAAMLSEQLERKRNCVLILDDVWERLDLEEVGIPFEANVFKLVLTTRSFDVCCQMRCQKKIKIEPLSQEEAESLFLEELAPEEPLTLETEKVAKSIVKKCAGLPLGLITMARSMRGVTDVFEWRDSWVKLEESCKGQTEMEKVLTNLKFSYDRLGDPNVQQCFLSCALYPKDESVHKFELVEFFIDQEFISGLNTRKEQYDRGLTILNKLGNVCLLEDHGSMMTMHDLIRDMALHIMSSTSIVKARKGLKMIPSEEYWTYPLEKVSLMKNDIGEFPLNMSPNCPKLSTLLFNKSLTGYNIIPDSFFDNLWGLKVLNLSGCDITELPNAISDLVNLRSLLLSQCHTLHRIPYLGKLTSLKKLDVGGCALLEVPQGLEMLMNLRYLDLDPSLSGRLPKGVLGRLLKLQHLKAGVVDGEDITKLRALETLECYFKDADDFNKCVRAIEQGNPCNYYLRMYPKAILDEQEESDGAQFMNQKRRVNILEWGHAIVSVGGKCTGIFILIPRGVKKMTITNCDGITNLSGMGPLECLEELNIKGWENLGLLFGGYDEEVIDIHDSPGPTLTPFLFPSLRSLYISYCPKLKYLFGHGSKFSLPHLQKIQIYGCEEMVGIITAVTSPPPHPPPAFPSLEEIYVEFCGKMKRVVESEWMPHFPNLRTIAAFNCKKMEEIIGGPPPHVPLEQISLESLCVYGCHNMRKLFLHEWLLHLRNLESIEVKGCKGMVEMISGAGQGQEGSIMTPVNNTILTFQPPSISLPNLKQLNLYDLPQLKSICGVPISCGSMEELRVYECPELKAIPLQLRLRDIDIEELPYIWVEDEEKWKTLMWDDPNAQAILQPYLRKGEQASTESFPLVDRWCSPNAIELDTKRNE